MAEPTIDDDSPAQESPDDPYERVAQTFPRLDSDTAIGASLRTAKQRSDIAQGTLIFERASKQH